MPFEEWYGLFYLSEAPLISLSPRIKYYIEGDHVSITCEASGKPQPDVVWIKNGVLESSVKPGLLEFHNVNRTDAGNYTCRANNSVEVTSFDRTIVVYCKYILNLNFLFPSLLYLQCDSSYWGKLHKTDESVQMCKETEFHLKSFSALYALVPSIGWDNWIWVEALLTSFC